VENILKKIMQGYQIFRKKYAMGDQSVMQYLSHYGQQPEIMVVACCDSRVDPALILQCDPGDLFVVRNVANIIPPYEKDEAHHGTSAALEFGIRFLKVKHLILLGHSQCGGIQTLLSNQNDETHQNDFITNWVSLLKNNNKNNKNNKNNIDYIDEYAKSALNQSLQHCLTFPWIKEKIAENKLNIHLWFFDIKKGKIFAYSSGENTYKPLDSV
jgi:carbonic anhydrase